MSRRLPVFLALALVAACTAPTASEDEDLEASAGALQSTPLADGEMKPYRQPAGMPKPWDQPDSTGFFEERGKCGPTAVANLLRLYGQEVSPAQADQQGVHWVIGTRGITIRNWFEAKHPELGCTLEHPTDGPAFLREHLAKGEPVLVWFNTAGSLSSHWVVAVGIDGSGAEERVVVMSWGRYYSIAMSKLDAAWRNVYWIRRPSIVCGVKTPLVPAR